MREEIHMKIRIVADSSANLKTDLSRSLVSAPLKITVGEKTFVDDENLSVKEMADYLAAYNGKSGSACPGTGEWLEAFGDADWVFVVTITSNLSGAYNAARVAMEQHLEEHPDCKIHVFDSLSTAGEMKLIVEKIEELAAKGMEFEAICEEVNSYMKKTYLEFTLKSLRNLANNGRVSPAVAKLAGMIGLQLVGKASEVGTLEPTDKVRGEKKALLTIYKNMKALGYNGGKVRIDHCLNLAAAEKLAEMIRSDYPQADITIDVVGGLCCFYAEVGGLLIGFETE